MHLSQNVDSILVASSDVEQAIYMITSEMDGVVVNRIVTLFQRDQANAKTDYQHDYPIPETVADVIYPTFLALSDASLLSKC